MTDLMEQVVIKFRLRPQLARLLALLLTKDKLNWHEAEPELGTVRLRDLIYELRKQQPELNIETRRLFGYLILPEEKTRIMELLNGQRKD